MSHHTDTPPRSVEQATPHRQPFHLLSPSAEWDAILARSTGTYYFFDKLRHRDSVTPPDDLIAFLDTNAHSCTVKPDRLHLDHEIITVAANIDALQVFAAQNPFWHLVEAEPAVEICFAHRRDAVALHHLLDRYLVHDPRRRLRIVTHRRGETITPEEAEARRVFGEHTSYTGGRESDFLLAWYSRFPSKSTGEPCLKLEARIKWSEQLQRCGISNATLCSFGIAAFLDAQYRLLVPDPVAVALDYLRDHRQPLPKSRPSRFNYDWLRSLGNVLIRERSLYPGKTHCFRSSQAYVTAAHTRDHLRPI